MSQIIKNIQATAGVQSFQFTVDPTVNDDFSDGYLQGDRWINTVSGEEFVLIDGTNGAAVWKLTTAIGGITVNENNQIIFENNVLIEGGMVFGPAITQNIASNTNNLIITGINGGVLVRLTSSTNINITGLVNPDITQGLWVIINNIGANNITLTNNDAASLANNRFLLGTSKNLQPDEGLTIIYDTVSLRWRPFGINI